MASKKPAAAIVKMVSTAGTGFFYTTRKSRLLGKKLTLNKYAARAGEADASLTLRSG